MLSISNTGVFAKQYEHLHPTPVIWVPPPYSITPLDFAWSESLIANNLPQGTEKRVGIRVTQSLTEHIVNILSQSLSFNITGLQLFGSYDCHVIIVVII